MLPKNMLIGLLIGASCSKTLEPEDVPSSKDGGPFAFTMELRWCAVESSFATISL